MRTRRPVAKTALHVHAADADRKVVMKAFYLVAILFLAAPLFGRLGDTKAELVERLGPVRTTSKHFVTAQGKIIPLGPNHSFQKDGWMIECDMIDDRCARIRYHKKGELTEKQLTLLLTKNAGSGRWSETKASTKMIREWLRSDRATATWKFTGVLEISSPVYLAAEARVQAQAKSDATKLPSL
jgi:hypothetical protein